jgi:hypothetical protein
MARAAFLMDKIMGGAGLHGRAFIPLLSSFACAIPGIMATRVIDNRRDRLTTVLVAPLMTCSARIPVYTLIIAALLVSRLPVFSGKRVGTRVLPELVGPVIVVVVLCIALLIAYPWALLTAGTLAYLASLPFGWLSYREYERRSREGRVEAMPAAASPPPFAASQQPPAEQDERPSRLN